MCYAEKFSDIIEELNERIGSFNEFLSEECAFTLIDPTSSASYSEKLREIWGRESWPNKDSYGVYFLFGTSEQDPERVGLYIGKASMKYMGHRFWAHFKKDRGSRDYHKRLGDEKFLIYAVASVPVLLEARKSIAVALEEFLITGGFTNATLINKIGRRQ